MTEDQALNIFIQEQMDFAMSQYISDVFESEEFDHYMDAAFDRATEDFYLRDPDEYQAVSMIELLDLMSTYPHN